MYVLLIIAIYSDSCVEKTLIYYPHITKKCDICDMIQIETIFDILVKGFIIGVVVSAPLGPVGVLCIQRTLNKGRWYGFVTGLGASLSDIAYALLTGYGMSFVFDYINKNIFYLQLLGSVMLLLFFFFFFRSNPVQSIRPASSSKGSYFHNFITAFFVTLSNPLIIFLFIGLFARFAFVQPGVLVFEEITGYLAIAIGALTWWLGITYFVNKVYPKLGFDETHFMDDFDETNILREYITDQELYDGIIDRYENRKNNEKLYIMGITMQNHGGYGTRYDNFDQEVYKLGDSYTDGNQYLSLIHESDKAFKNLITYFQNVDDPVEIVFFGDHQPGLYSEFIKLINGKGTSGLSEDEIEKLYTVPFYIWTNYETEAKTVDITSLNYLSTMTLERANIDLPAYNQFLADMMEVVPAINSRGYYSKTAGGFLHIDEATGEEAEWIKNYNILQYNSMFDEKNKSSLFFPYIK